MSRLHTLEKFVEPRPWIAVFAALAMLAPVASQGAEPDPAEVTGMVPALVPVADKACSYATSRVDLSSQDLDRAAMLALSDIERMDQARDLPGIRVRLSRFKDEVGGIDDFPSLRLQLFLGYLAGRDGDIKQQAYHRAYALALTQVMEKNGMGETAARAIRPCLVINEYDWIHFRAGMERPGSQGLQSIDGRSYDVLEAKGPRGKAASVYFDVTEMMQQAGHAHLAPSTAQ